MMPLIVTRFLSSSFFYQVIITGLTPGQYYNINITAVNIIGLGPVLMINGDLYNIAKLN